MQLLLDIQPEVEMKRRGRRRDAAQRSKARLRDICSCSEREERQSQRCSKRCRRRLVDPLVGRIQGRPSRRCTRCETCCRSTVHSHQPSSLSDPLSSQLCEFRFKVSRFCAPLSGPVLIACQIQGKEEISQRKVKKLFFLRQNTKPNGCRVFLTS